MSFITTKGRTPIYYKDLGGGQSVVFSHGCAPAGRAITRRISHEC